jgi:uncharacterized small protein (DUF1192 family)
MTEEPALPRTKRGALLDELAREDLDLYSVEDLNERIERLEAEIGRARKARDRKQSGRAAADALFSLGKA